MGDKRDQLYDNLINSGRVGEDEIGTREQFKAAIKDEAASRVFYQNIIKSGKLTEDEIGSEDDFYGSISSDFFQPVVRSTKSEGYRPTEEEMAGFEKTIDDAGLAVTTALPSFDKKVSNLKKRRGLNVSKRSNIGETNNLAEGDWHLNPDNGKLEQSYITSMGNEYDSKFRAEAEQRQIDEYDRRMRYATGQAMDDLSKKYIDPLVDKAMKDATDRWYASMAESSSAPMGEGGELFALRRANESIDPDKILQDLQKTLESTYKNPEMQEELSRLAQSIGLSTEDYLEQVVAPSLAARLENSFMSSQIAKNMPKNSVEYVLQGLGNSIGGMLMSAAVETKSQRYYKNQAEAMTEEGNNPYYNPGTGAKLTKMGISFAADAPFFGVYGRVSGQVAKGIAERQIRKMMAKGLSETAARSIVGTALENSVGARMKNYLMQHVVSSSLTMGMYNASSEAARQIRDKEGVDLGRIAGSTAEGLAVGGAFGVTGGFSQALSQPLSGISKVGAKVAGFGAEAGTMYATEEAAKMAHGDEGFTNPFAEGYVEALEKLSVMKLSGGHLLESGAKKIARAKEVGVGKAAVETVGELLGQNRTGVKFDKEEQDYIRNTNEGQNLIDALSQMHPDKAISEVNGKKQLTKEGEAMRRQLADNYNEFMSNKDIPANVKEKTAAVLGGVYRRGLETGVDIIQSEDGSVTLKTRDKDGNCIQDIKFDSFEEAKLWQEAHKSQFSRNDAADMWNNASKETRQKIVDAIRDEVSGKKTLAEKKAEIEAQLAKATGMKQKRLLRQLAKVEQLDKEYRRLADEYEGREMTDEEAHNYIQLVIKDGSDDVFGDMYSLISDIAHPADEYNPKYNYDQGRKIDPMERHFAQVDLQVAEERLGLIGPEFAKEVMDNAAYADDKMVEIASNPNYGKEEIEAAREYYNALSKLNGMMDEALKTIDGQVEAANARVRRNTHTGSGALISAYYNGKECYITAGNFKLTPDGSLEPTDNSGLVILRDKQTGDINTANPQNVRATDVSDPNREIEYNESMEGLRGQLIKQADDTIELHPETPAAPQEAGEIFTDADGKTYMLNPVRDEAGNEVWTKIEVELDADGIPEKTIGEPQPLDIDEYRKAKSNEIDASERPQEETAAPTEGEQPVLEQNEPVAEQNGTVLEQEPNPLEQELEQRLHTEEKKNAEETAAPASRIPVDEKGRKQYEQAKPEDTISELTEKYGEQGAQQFVSSMAENTAKALEELQQKDISKITDANDLEAYHDQLAELQKKADYWKGLMPKKVEEEIKPISTGPLGNNYDQFRGNAKAAVDFLLEKKEGNAVGALHHKDVGDIDLWYGNEKAGLEKIAEKHPEVLDNLQGILDGMHVVKASENCVILESDTHKAIISKMLGDEKTDNWLLSAYEKKGTSASSSDIETEPEGKQNGTAPLQNSPSGDKDTKNNDTNQGNQQENVQQQPVTPPQPQQPTARQKVAQGVVRNNIGKRYTFQNQDGTRSEVVINSFKGDDLVEVTRQDYDTDGNAKGETYSQELKLEDVGNSIVNGYMKPVASVDERLRKQYKFDRFKQGEVPIIDVLTDAEKQQILEAFERNDTETVGRLTGEFMNDHKEDIILKGRDIRNAQADKILSSSSGREEKLRRLRLLYGPDIAESYLSDDALYPASAEDWVSELNSRVPKKGEGIIAYFTYEKGGAEIVGLQDESGFGTKTGGDNNGYAPWLAPKGKGLSLQKYAEHLHGQLPDAVQKQYTDQEMRNAVLEVFGSAQRPSDITTMLIRRGVLQAEAAMRKMEEKWMEDGPSYQKVTDENVFASRLKRAKEQVNTEPTDGQKKAGNYKKAHISFGGYDFTIENPEGSIRRGKDATGREWEQKMNNSYGYILGKYGKDGDHLDMFINDNADLDNWNGTVYVIDQIDPKTGKFDEHKCLYGFDSLDEAKQAYLSNYEEGWQGLGRITGVSKEGFDKWIDSSKRKMKEFADHSIAKEHMVESEDGARTPQSRDQVIRDAVVEHLRSKGIEVSDDWQLGQRILDEYNSSGQVKKMGQKTNKKKARIAADLEGMNLTPEQQAVVDVYTGKKDNQSFTVTRDDGDHRVIMRQGNESHAGTQHSLFRHYDTNVGTISSEELLSVPIVVENGELTPKQEGKRRLMIYKHSKDGVEYTVVTEKKEGKEIFNDFYTNRKASSPASFNTPEGARSTRDNALSDAKVQQNTETAKDSEEKISFQKVTDADELQQLENGPTVKRYRAMQLIDGKLYPPMSAKVGKEMREPTEIGVWEKSEERPDLIDKNGKFVLNKGQKGQGSVPAAYNPYFHTSTSGLNDQFTSAYKRPELVVVEVEIPESELTSGYKAEGAKDAVGDTDWHSGPVNGSLPDDRKRTVTLSRYAKVNRIVPDSEVAEMIAKQLEGTDVEVPYNVVTPQLRKALEERGVKISDKPAGTVTEDINGKPIEKTPKFFKTTDGQAYGYTYKGKIYVDPRIATAETPIHEYSHLWAEMKRQTAPEEWEQMKQVMINDKLVQPIIERVKRDYPELAKEGREDDFIEEVITQFSGKRGAERLREIADEIAREKGGVFGKAEAVTAMQRLKNILNRFWEGVAKMMGWKYTNANQIADRMMADLLNGVNPRKSLTPDPIPADTPTRSLSPKGEGSEVLKSQQEIKRTLMGVHNISEEKLRKAIKQGGLANPSLAVIDTRNGMHNDYGEISLIPRSSLIDSKTGRNAGTFAGDAWTPTYPQVEKQMSDKGRDAYYKDVNGVSEDKSLTGELKMVWDNYLDGCNPDKLAYWFLKEQGTEPEKVFFDSGYTEEQRKRYAELTDGGRKGFEDMNDEERFGVVSMMAEQEGISAEEKLAKYQTLRERNAELLSNEDTKPFRKALLQRTIDEIDKYGITLSPVSNFLYGMKRALESDGKLNVGATLQKAHDKMQAESKEKDFQRWLEEKEQKYGVKEMLFDGYTRDGDRKYIPNTVENASRMMNREAEANAGGQTGFGASRAMLLSKMHSLAEIRKQKGKLKGIDKDSEQRYQAASDEMFHIVKALSDMQKISDNPFSNVDYANNRLNEALTKKDPIGYLNREYGYDIDKNGEFAKGLKTMLQTLEDLPVKYFETKFRRPVGLDEFAIAVVPERTSPEVIRSLQDAGLDVRTYDGNTGSMEQNDANRQRVTMEAVKDRSDIMFQKSRDNSQTVAERSAEYDKENGTELGRFLDYLNRGKKLNKGEGSHFKVAVAGNLLNKYGIKGDIKTSTSTVSKRHTRNVDHELTDEDWLNAIASINTPLAITKNGSEEGNYRIYTTVMKEGKQICMGVEVRKAGRGVDVTNVWTAFARDVKRVLNEGNKETLLYPEKEEDLIKAVQEYSSDNNPRIYPERLEDSPSDGKDTINSDNFQEKTEKSSIQGLEGYTEKDVTDLVEQHFKELTGDADLHIVGMKVIGSRTKGKAKDNSDLDVLLEYEGKMSEDGLFNLLNDEENRLYIEGIPVDINPITRGKGGTIEQWLKRNANYDKESENNSIKFQRAGSPEPELTPEERQYWNKWDADMKKWKERNAIPEDQTAAPEKPRYQQGESALDYAQKLVRCAQVR